MDKNIFSAIDTIDSFLTKEIEKYDNIEQALFSRMIKLTEEVWELSEQVLWKVGQQRASKKDSINDDELWNEIADVVICALLIGKIAWIDNQQAVQKKIEKIYNRHGLS